MPDMSWEEAEVSRVGGLEWQLLDLGEMVCVRHLTALSLRRRVRLTVKAGEAFHLRASHIADALEDQS